MNSFLRKTAMAIVIAILMVVSVNSIVNAVSMKGYFTGATQMTPDGEHVISGGIDTSVNSPSDLVSALEAKYNDGLAQDRVGVAFIINTVVNSGSFPIKRDLPASYWTEFERILTLYDNAGLIAWGKWVNLQDSSSLNGVNSLYSPSMNDDRYYYDSENKNVYTIFITNKDGSFAYALKYDCGNPVGGVNIVPPAAEEPLIPASGKCRPIVFVVPEHTRAVGNSRDGQTGTSALSVTLNVVNKTTNQSVFRKSYTAETSVDLTIPCTTGDQFTATITIPSHTESWKSYKKSPCGTRTSCTRYKSVPATHSLTSSSVIGPCYDYLLKSSIQAITNYQVEVGSTITITPTISNSSWTQINNIDFWNIYKTSTKSKPTEWQISKLKVDPDNTIPNVSASSVSVAPCSFYSTAKGFSKCAAEKTGTNIILKKDSVNTTISNTTPIPSFSVSVTDEDAGTKICYALSLRSATSEGTDSTNNNESSTLSGVWYHSAVSKINCVIVVKKPKVQVLGGDVKTGRSFDGVNAVVQKLNILTLNSVKTVDRQSKTFGSWAEYGLFAAGTIRGMGSQSAFNGGMAATSSGTPQANYSKLTFSNSGSTSTCSSSTNGCYSYKKATIPDISASYPEASASKTVSGNVSLDTLTSGVYRAAGNITITGGNITPGKWIVINGGESGRSVVINGNIQYSTTKVKTINDIPQVVIIARNIDIADNVTNVDAWLIAKSGYLNTCQSHRTTNLSTADCENRLTINGPVMVSTLYLRRTAGSGTNAASGDPAEIFNLRADAYLWAYARATGSGRVWTVYTTNVPTRL